MYGIYFVEFVISGYFWKVFMMYVFLLLFESWQKYYGSSYMELNYNENILPTFLFSRNFQLSKKEKLVKIFIQIFVFSKINK